MSGNLLTYLVCRNNRLIDLANNTSWTNTNVDIVNNGKLTGYQCLYFSNTDNLKDSDSATKYITATNSDLLRFGLQDWTISFWFKMDRDTNPVSYKGRWNSQYNSFFCTQPRENGEITLLFDGITHEFDYMDNYHDRVIGPFEEVFPNGYTVWNYIAITHHLLSGSLNLFINGKKVWSLDVGQNLSLDIRSNLTLGTCRSVYPMLDGYIDHFMVVSGEALYTEDFDVPVGFSWPFQKTIYNNLTRR